MRYAIVIEKLESNYSAYVPDLLGCVATGATLEEIEQQIKEVRCLSKRAYHSFPPNFSNNTCHASNCCCNCWMRSHLAG